MTSTEPRDPSSSQTSPGASPSSSGASSVSSGSSGSPSGASAVPAGPSADLGGSGPVRRLPGQTGGPLRRFLSRWGFPLFLLLILVLGRRVLLPFVFAGLIAYILSPVVRWMAERRDGTRRLHRGIAIVLCYIVFISAIVGFLFLLVPRLSKDVARIGSEAPALLKRVNEEWAPQAAQWVEKRVKLSPAQPAPAEPPIVADVPLPPGTAFTLTPLPDGRYAMSMTPSGVQVRPLPNGGFHLQTEEKPPEPATMEDKIRALASKRMIREVDQLLETVFASSKFGA